LGGLEGWRKRKRGILARWLQLYRKRIKTCRLDTVSFCRAEACTEAAKERELPPKKKNFSSFTVSHLLESNIGKKLALPVDPRD